MAVVAKMNCTQTTERGQQVTMPKCHALQVLDSWPPEDDDRVTAWEYSGHDYEEGGCCYDEDGIRAAHVSGEVTQQDVRLDALTDEVNSQWAQATPSGNLEFTVQNPAVFGFFRPGAEYIVEVRRHVPQRSPKGRD